MVLIEISTNVLIEIPMQWWVAHREPYCECAVVEAAMRKIFLPNLYIC
jgi:hypothetical protein